MSKYFSVWVTKQQQPSKKKAQETSGRLKAACEGPTQQVDDAFVISSEEPDGVFEEEHEGCVDDSVSQLIGVNLGGNIHQSEGFFYRFFPYGNTPKSRTTF